MNQTILASVKLAPQYNIPDQLPTINYASHLLLGQEKTIDSFNLASSLDNQHLFLADFPGVNRIALFDALTTQAQNVTDHYLVASKSMQDETQVAFNWQSSLPSEQVGKIATQDKTYCYLRGRITRKQLIGQVVTKGNSSQYQAGTLAENHYIFICAESLWKREGLWELVMQIIDEQKYKVNSELASIPLRSKIVLVGSSNFFSQIRQDDSIFMQYFPILAELNHELDLTKYKEIQYIQWLQYIAQLSGITIDKTALLPLFWYSAKLVEHQQRLSLSMLAMSQLISQAAAYSASKSINAHAVATAIQKHVSRHNISEEFSAQSFDDKFIHLATDGELTGQINGLTVIDTGDYSYGEPARITTSVHYGDGEVADIERKSELGGNIHAKGMMILSACLYRIFGRDAPLHLNANIVFEQSYQEIDGDSASLAEYCCLMSAIAEKPVMQFYGVTGALDQFGNVQAIGGINEKIEGFFNLCKRRGLTGKQGIIMPATNVLQLNLMPEVIQAVNDGQFVIHAISHMDEAIELLMQMPAGQADENNSFPQQSLYGLVQQRLDKLAGHGDEVELTFFGKVLTKLGIL
ncbi:S16 family serine protease [Shewanella intestini]|uniref:endopeptidase La n=1 Tax=Shewanella intestini TaxID=2017544 RepID=A0ABS5I0Y3_9GAMM|nr:MULTISPECIES: S16 family serine protease [Shewanella]MBR9727488.1 AAA family ATPase [Shewanella intestini]MRG35462.1 AAA family ATPase [Shewanella sp. XMDDZSB0408]